MGYQQRRGAEEMKAVVMPTDATDGRNSMYFNTRELTDPQAYLNQLRHGSSNVMNSSTFDENQHRTPTTDVMRTDGRPQTTPLDLSTRGSQDTHALLKHSQHGRSYNQAGVRDGINFMCMSALDLTDAQAQPANPANQEYFSNFHKNPNRMPNTVVMPTDATDGRNSMYFNTRELTDPQAYLNQLRHGSSNVMNSSTFDVNQHRMPTTAVMHSQTKHFTSSMHLSNHSTEPQAQFNRNLFQRYCLQDKPNNPPRMPKSIMMPPAGRDERDSMYMYCREPVNPPSISYFHGGGSSKSTLDNNPLKMRSVTATVTSAEAAQGGALALAGRNPQIRASCMDGHFSQAGGVPRLGHLMSENTCEATPETAKWDEVIEVVADKETDSLTPPDYKEDISTFHNEAHEVEGTGNNMHVKRSLRPRLAHKTNAYVDDDAIEIQELLLEPPAGGKKTKGKKTKGQDSEVDPLPKKRKTKLQLTPAKDKDGDIDGDEDKTGPTFYHSTPKGSMSTGSIMEGVEHSGQPEDTLMFPKEVPLPDILGKAPPSDATEWDCAICFAVWTEGDFRGVLHPCKHDIFCYHCSLQFYHKYGECPVCRSKISGEPESVPYKKFIM